MLSLEISDLSFVNIGLKSDLSIEASFFQIQGSTARLLNLPLRSNLAYVLLNI